MDVMMPRQTIYHFKFFKGCLPQILLGPFSNTLAHFVLLNVKVLTDFILPLKTGCPGCAIEFMSY